MKTIKHTIVALLVANILISCSKDDNTDHTVQRFDRNITFKVVGQYSGSLKAIYANPTDEYGVTPSEVLNSTPWLKSLEYNPQVALTGLALVGQNGHPNEIVQLQVFSNDELIESEFGIADDQGKLYAETSVIYFK
ncbi:hypothetical protein [Flavobacterium sp.]|uniref:hypothetical protein n=1 Tax=Flavobacterium sp. TaxID=239 RepID=UPI00262076E5|nr:hypothetical protein [Flavobacterium sp.]